MAVAVAGSRVDQYKTTITLTMPNGSLVQPWSSPGFNEWDTIVGGAITSSEVKYQPAGGAQQIALGGVITTDNLTLTRIYDFIRDFNNLNALIAAVSVATMTVTKYPLNRDWSSVGKNMIYTGTLLTVTPPDGDSASSGNAAMLSIICSVSGQPSIG